MQKNKYTRELIADTSALVLLWCGHEIYHSGAVRDYANMLDLGRGKRLFEKCNRIWSEYGSVIRYRKLCIAREAVAIIGQEHIRQVAILGAGFSMLGIELAATFPNLEVFELDHDQMQEKEKMTNRLSFAENSRLACVSADVEDIARCRFLLSEAGWRQDEPTLLLIEGLSYYISKEAVRRQWGMLTTGSRIIFEYLVPPDQVSASRRQIPESVFNEIMSYCSSDSTLTYWNEDQLANENEVKLDSCYGLCDIENILKPEKRLFEDKKSGWIEVAVLTRKAFANAVPQAPTLPVK
ncbi:MAG: hypothetical protein HGB22_02860 [Chlorobiaceae bacterium]|nr:hypothetical protein [Chlorobiaceae bacterium]